MSDKFLTYNQKLVIQWRKEHQGIIELIDEIIYQYKANNQVMIRQELDKFYELTTEHLASEDMEFYKLSMLEESLDEDLRKELEDFVKTFEKTKFVLMDFLMRYTNSDAIYNEDFISIFKGIVKVLEQRISYENKNLYKTLYSN